MKIPFLPAAALMAALTLAMPASAQEFVSESPVILNATILTQGADASVTTVQGHTTITTKKVVTATFGNRELLASMEADKGIEGPSSLWSLVLLVDTSGQAGLFASKLGSAPVRVPENLLSMPELSARVAGGITVSGANGETFDGLSETAFASITVDGIPASGLANSTPDKPSTGSKSGSTILNFTGGSIDAQGSKLIKGVLEFKSSTISPLAEAPVR